MRYNNKAVQINNAKAIYSKNHQCKKATTLFCCVMGWAEFETQIPLDLRSLAQIWKLKEIKD